MHFIDANANDPNIIYNVPDNTTKPFTIPPDPFNHFVNNDTFADPSNNYINPTQIYDNIPLNDVFAPCTATDGPIDAGKPFDNAANPIDHDNPVDVPNIHDDD